MGEGRVAKRERTDGKKGDETQERTVYIFIVANIFVLTLTHPPNQYI